VRRAFRRVTSLVLTLILTSLAAMAALGVLARAPATGEPRELPSFVNPHPRDARGLASAAVERLRAGDDEAAARTLARLGGAALPHVLAKLDELPLPARRRVALALAPVGRRMELSRSERLADPDRAIGFWRRFWRDRAFDFRPQLVKRSVERLAQKSSVLRREDILPFDTYAVPALIEALGRVSSPAERERAARLTGVLAHVTERPWVVTATMPLAEADTIVLRWRAFWIDSGADFTTLEGARRVGAMFVQTRYARWIRRLAAPGVRGSGATLDVRRALASASGYLAAIALAVALGTWLTRRELTQRRGAGLLALRTLAIAGAAVPAVFWMRALPVPRSSAAAHALSAIAAGLALGFVLTRLSVRRLEEASATEKEAWRTSLTATLSSLPGLLPWLLTSLFALELSFGVDGAAKMVLEGLSASDVSAGMAVALGGATIAALTGLAADRALAAAGPSPFIPGLLEVDGARSRRRLVLVLALLGLLLATSALGASSAFGPVLGHLADGARFLLVHGAIAMGVAGVLGIALGALSARTTRAIDGALARAVEVSAALPAAVWAAALAAALGGGVRFAIALGALRAFDVAWVVRTELLRLASTEAPLDEGAFGHSPLAPYLRQRRAALRTGLTAAALTPAWVMALGTAALLTGLSGRPSAAGWPALFTGQRASLGGLFAAVLLAALTAALLSAVAPAPRILGAPRSSRPPAPRRPADPPPSERNAELARTSSHCEQDLRRGPG